MIPSDYKRARRKQYEKNQNTLAAALLKGVVNEMQYQREIIKRGISITSDL